QELRGRVVVEGTPGEPVDGALVALLSPADSVVDAGFSNLSGFFVLGAPVAGPYRVRIERIGFESWTSGALDLDLSAPRSAEFAIPIRPVRLARIDVSIERQCMQDPREAEQFAIVWSEARKALEAARLAQREEMFRFNSILFDRELSWRGREIAAVATEAANDVVEAPFRSLPADRLSAQGYIGRESEDDGTIYFYAPDAEVLLSREFMRDHCFELDRGEEDGRSRIGIVFEPRDDRELTDISGVLWLDEATAELERVEFEYERLPFRGIDDRGIGGEVQYARLPGGAFVVRDWFIRMPALAREEGRERYRIRYFTEYGGQLREVFDSEGSPVRWLEGAVIRGEIWNPIADRPLGDAIVTLDRPDGPDIHAHTGPRGEFLFHGLDEGRHRLTYHHPLFATIDWRPPRQEVLLATSEVVALSFALPDPDGIRADRCGDEANGGLVFGRVLPERGLPYSGVQVDAEWDPLRAAGRGRSAQVQRISDRTDSNGVYELCGVPPGVDISLYLKGSDGPVAWRRVRLERSVLIEDFQVDGE
ncbi:MAG: carboxypeptidase-like regulatory domain-containing protein, partial [Gemmatimonadota bacterium]|nr:carboxypeptidase-like regulatory domain-containing protein [Gemmatimonadota bacterium]